MRQACFVAGVVYQSINREQLKLLVDALCSDAIRGADQQPAQQQLLAVICNTISLAGIPPANVYHICAIEATNKAKCASHIPCSFSCSHRLGSCGVQVMTVHYRQIV